MKERIDLFNFFKIIRKNLIWLILASLAGFLVSYGVTRYVISPQYEAVTRLIVSRTYIEDQTVELGDIQSNIQLISTYRDVINDPIVLDEVRENLSFDITEEKLVANISIHIRNDSQIFGISVTSDSPERAAEIANLIALTFQNNIGSIINVDNVSILSPARPNPIPVSPRVLINLVIGTFIGCLSGVMICLIIYVLDKKVYDEKTVYELLGWTNLGAISEMNSKILANNRRESHRKKADLDSANEAAHQGKGIYKEGTSHV